MKNSATSNKPSDAAANKISQGASANKPAEAGKNPPANAKNAKAGTKGSPIPVEEEVIPPPPKESNKVLFRINLFL